MCGDLMKRIILLIIAVMSLITSSCAEFAYRQTENARQGQTYEEYEEEQKRKKDEWRLHQTHRLTL